MADVAPVVEVTAFVRILALVTEPLGMLTAAYAVPVPSATARAT